MFTKWKNNRLMLLLVFVLPMMFFSTNIFGYFGSENNDNIILKITPENFVTLPVLTFKKAGKQRVTIENHLAEKIIIGEIFFLGDDFTKPLITRDISTLGHSIPYEIPAGKSYSFLIQAAANASSTINPQGEQLLLNYKVVTREENKFVPFKIKIDYNKDVEFKVRNIEFSKPGIKRLVINNTNGEAAINVTGVKFLQKEIGVIIKDYSGCANLNPGQSCEVEIESGESVAAVGERVIPIHVTYDVVNREGVQQKVTDLVAVAAAIINYNPKASKTQIGQAMTSGIVSGVDMTLVYGENIENIVKSIFIATIGEKAAKLATDASIGVLAGASYSATGAAESNDYDGNGNINKLFDAGATQVLLGLISCVGKAGEWAVATDIGGYGAVNSPVVFKAAVLGYGVCVAATIGCGLLSTFGSKLLSSVIYSNVVMRLPEQSWYATLKDKSKLLFNFGVSAVIRVVCKDTMAPHGGIIEVGQDLLSAATMVSIPDLGKAIKGMFSRRDAFLVPPGKNETQLATDCCSNCCIASERPTFVNYDCDSKECICASVQP